MVPRTLTSIGALTPVCVDWKVHITQGDHVGEAVIVSWITPSKPGKSVVYYGNSKGDYSHKAKGKYTWYTYYNYTSGYIHHVTIRNLQVLSCATSSR